MKTITSAQLSWMLNKGFAWADSANSSEECHCLAEVYWTREGGYMWNVDIQKYEMCL